MKYRFLLKILLLILATTPLTILHAQDDVPECDYTPTLEEIINLATEPDDAAAALDEIAAIISAAKIECSGLSFNSEDEGMQPLIGPITLPEGMYRATLTIDGMGMVSMESLDGNCGEDQFGLPLFMVMEMGESETQALVDAGGGECLIKFENVTMVDEWTLTFEKLK